MSWWDTEPHSGEYGGRTVVPPAWPHVDEYFVAQAAQKFETLASHIRTSIVPGLQAQMMALSDAWEGAGSEAARDEALAIIGKHEANATAADDIAKKLRAMETSVVKTKNAVNSTAEQVQHDCETFASDETLSSEAREALIEGRIAEGLTENVGVVSTNAIELAGNIGVAPGIPGADGKMPDGGPPPATPVGNGKSMDADSLGHSFAPAVISADNMSSHGSNPEFRRPSGVGAPATTPAPDAPAALPARQSPPVAPAPAQPPAVSSGATPSVARSSGGAGSSSPGSGGASSMGGSANPSGSGSSPGGAGKSPSVSPAAAGAESAAASSGRSSGGGSPAQPIAPPLSTPAPATQPAQTPSPAQAPPPAASSPAPPASGFSGGGFGGAAPGGVAGGPAPMPLAPPATPTPAAPVGGAPSAAGLAGPGVAPASTSAGAGPGAAAPVPVSAARAERDAIATAASAGALRRLHGGSDPSQRARRIAAALNVGISDFGFYWVTAITTEGSIVVANSYGIGYIPANVLLPEQVHMATAEESIPVVERARWATYPILALQGWARHRDEHLRLVIATADQLQGFDPGVATSILQPDDMPDDGTMQGRTRLEVLAPGSAAKLAATRDEGLADLLPAAQAEINAVKDDLAVSWFEVCKPLMSTSTARVGVHLEAMSTYSVEAMESALCKAQAEPEFAAKRAAIADWVYWQHQHSILADALESPVAQ